MCLVMVAAGRIVLTVEGPASARSVSVLAGTSPSTRIKIDVRIVMAVADVPRVMPEPSSRLASRIADRPE